MLALRQLLTERFDHLGKEHALAPLTLDFKVSNQLFVYETDQGRFVVKCMASADALYGHAGSAERLEAVAQATGALRAADLPVETIIAGANGRYTQRLGDQLVRVYAFEPGRGFTGSIDEVRASATALRRLHADGLAVLPEDIAARLAGFCSAYPLAETASDLPEIREFVRHAAGSEAVFAQVLEDWPLLERSVHAALAHAPLHPAAATTIHTDAHPRNIILRDGKAILIDLDNLLIDRRFKCLGFSILRFGFAGKARTPEVLLASTEQWCSAEERADPAFLADLTHGMLLLEAEKAVRILLRYFRTGTYFDFVANVSPVHVANLAAILPVYQRMR